MKKIIIIFSLIGFIIIFGISLTHCHSHNVNSFNVSCSICINLTAFSVFSFQIISSVLITFIIYAVYIFEPSLPKTYFLKKIIPTRGPPS